MELFKGSKIGLNAWNVLISAQKYTPMKVKMWLKK
jgi:hypothetical protein